MSAVVLTETPKTFIKDPNFSKYKIDTEYGIESEKICLPLLKTKFDPFLIKNENRYAIFDYVGVSHFIELKTRRYNSDKYPDTMIGCNKIKNALKVEGRKVVFCFKFEDGLFYWEFDKEKIPNLDLRLGGRIDRGKDERRPYYFIKIADMIKIEINN
jgi:hypothetical protein